MDDSIRFAKKFIEDMLSFFGLNTEVKATCEDEVIELSVPSTHLNGFLIGQRGETLRALQFLTSVALKNNEHEITRVNLDVADYKRHRRERLAREVERWIDQVKGDKKPLELRPMSAADRRVVHNTVGGHGDVTSESVGEGRERRVVIHPASDQDSDEDK